MNGPRGAPLYMGLRFGPFCVLLLDRIIYSVLLLDRIIYSMLLLDRIIMQCVRIMLMHAN